MDVPVLSTLWTNMFLRLALKAGRSIEKAFAVKVITGVLAGIASFAGGVKLATTYFAWTGVGTLPAIVVNMGANGVLTYLFGRAVAITFLAETREESVEAFIRSILAIILGGTGGGDVGEATPS